MKTSADFCRLNPCGKNSYCDSEAFGLVMSCVNLNKTAVWGKC